MKFDYQYRITYESGEQVYNKRSTLCVDVTKEQYKKIVAGVLKGLTIEEIEGISDVLEEMTENVQFADRWTNKNGTSRSTPLKKPRGFSKLEFFMPELDYMRFKKMKDPLEVIDRPGEHMTIYRSDGSYIRLSTENGRVTIKDSKEENLMHIVDADHFISQIK